MRNFVLFFVILIVIDFIFSQLFFLDILYKKKITAFKNDITYRIPNEKYSEILEYIEFLKQNPS